MTPISNQPDVATVLALMFVWAVVLFGGSMLFGITLALSKCVVKRVFRLVFNRGGKNDD